jgi:hypothetical protein
MPRQRGVIGLNVGDPVDESAHEEVKIHQTRAHKKTANRQCNFWTWGIIMLILILVGVAITAIALALTNAHWSYDSDLDRISTRHAGADVEVKDGGNLVVHNSIVDSFEHTIYEKIILSPFFGPEGPDLLFGAANATYARLQASYAIGLRIWDRAFIPIGGVFASNGLFGEDGLAVALDTFVNWFHGPIIGTGPGILVISDKNAKENIESLDPRVALKNVAQLEPRSFDWKGARSAAGATLPIKRKMAMLGVHGFIAQEVGVAIPHAVHSTSDYLPEGKEFTPQALMDYNAIVVELVGAFQSLWANGVISAAQSGTQLPTVQRCLNNSTTPRETARCICNTIACSSSASPSCLSIARACGNA